MITQTIHPMIHLYTGNGKGKTTAALGLALRAAGAGKRVFIAIFVKGKPYSEHELLHKIPGITYKLYGRDCFIMHQPEPADVKAAQHGFREVKKIVSEQDTDMLILDEICIALHYQLINTEEFVRFLQQIPGSVEVVMTGRYAPEALYEISDLITEMQEVKHYYQQGIEARKGIEY